MSEFAQVAARDLQCGACVMTLVMQATVVGIRPHTQPARVIEILLGDTRGTLFIASQTCASRSLFVEVFGESWANDRSVSILSFRRFNNFQAALLESNILRG